ncbi:MAG: hypothetical protein FWD34_06730 [Oscillospiraceae bacterium]|nr:hypothetical protein [Oscillospiraceae bacterium]
MNNMDKMIQTAAKKLNMTPEALKDALSKGDLNAITANMDKAEAEKLNNALNNPEVVKNFTDSPEMSEYMKKMKDK